MEYPDAIADLISKSNSAIRRMPINKDELNGDFRKHSAFTAFRLAFYKTKRSLTEEEVTLVLQPHLPTETDLRTNRSVRRIAGRVDDLSAEWDAGIDTTYGYESLARRRFVGTVRLLSSLWRQVLALVPDRRPSWHDRAVKLNRIKVPGLILRVPRGFSNQFNVKQSLYDDMTSFTSKMQSALVSRYNRNEAGSNPNSYLIGNERVYIQKATYRRYVPMSSLLMRYLFGFNYSKLKKYKINETASTIVCHFSTNQSLERFFSIEGLSPISFTRHDVRYYGCGRLTIDVDNHGPTPSYIMKTTKTNKWVLRCIHNSNTPLILHMNAPTYEGGTLQFEPSYSYKQYTFTIVLGGDDDGEDDGDVDDDAPGYHPSRILIHKSKKMQSISYCIQKCCMTKDVNDKFTINQDLSS